MRFGLLLAFSMLVIPVCGRAESLFGGSYAKARQDGGPFDGTGSGYKIFAGGGNQLFSAEIAYIQFGKLGGDGPHAQAWASAITLGYPISYLTPYGKAGLAYSRVSGSDTSEEAKHTRFYWGGGLRAGGPQGLGLRAEYERFRLDEHQLGLISLGIEYRY